MTWLTNKILQHWNKLQLEIATDLEIASSYITDQCKTLQVLHTEQDLKSFVKKARKCLCP